MAALSVAKISQTAFAGLSSARIAIQAQQYASSKLDLLKTQKYENLTAQNKLPISDSSFYDSVQISPEYTNSDGIKCKDVTVDVFYDKNNNSSISLKRTFSTASSDTSETFKGWVNNFPASGTAPADGIITASSGYNSGLAISTSSVERVSVSGRSKYGQGYVTATCPVKKGESYSVSGARYIRFMKM